MNFHVLRKKPSWEVCYGEAHAQLSHGQKLVHYVLGPVAVPLADCVMSGPLVSFFPFDRSPEGTSFPLWCSHDRVQIQASCSECLGELDVPAPSVVHCRIENVPYIGRDLNATLQEGVHSGVSQFPEKIKQIKHDISTHVWLGFRSGIFRMDYIAGR